MISIHLVVAVKVGSCRFRHRVLPTWHFFSIEITHFVVFGNRHGKSKKIKIRSSRDQTSDAKFFSCFSVWRRISILGVLFGQCLERNAEPLRRGNAIREQSDMERRIVGSVRHGVSHNAS